MLMKTVTINPINGLFPCFSRWVRQLSSLRLRWLRGSDPRPLHPPRGPQPRVARLVSEVLRLREVPGRELHVLREGREGLLQGGLPQV